MAGDLYHCDNPLHGYGCFHLDEELIEEPSRLTEKEIARVEQLKKELYIDEYGDIEEALEEAKMELEAAEEKVENWSYAVDGLEELQFLMEKAKG